MAVPAVAASAADAVARQVVLAIPVRGCAVQVAAFCDYPVGGRAIQAPLRLLKHPKTVLPIAHELGGGASDILAPPNFSICLLLDLV